MMIDIIATILILYLLYKLVFDFIVPVSRTTKQFREHVNQMRNQQQQQAQHQNSQSSASNNTPSAKKSTTTTDGEYIDFEEVK